MKVLVKSDVPTWAFSRRAAAYQQYPPEGWKVFVGDDTHARRNESWDAVFLLDCTATPLAYGENTPFARLVASHAWCCNPDFADWSTHGATGHRCLNKVLAMLGNGGVVAVYNTAQKKALEQVGVKQRIVLAPYTIDQKVFFPGGRQTAGYTGEKLRIGWNYQVSGGLNSFKGLTHVLIPLISRLGDSVSWSVLTPEAGSCFDTEQLVSWYRSLDLFLCTSSGEGGPQGPLEAAACGCAVLSTDVGQMSDWDILKSYNLLFPTYRNAVEAEDVVTQMANRISHLAEHRLEIRLIASRLVQDIQNNWNAETECPKQLLGIFG